MESLVVEVLNIENFSEDKMDEKLEKVVIRNGVATFTFKDGTTDSRAYSSPKHGTKWSEESKDKMSRSMKKKWRERLGKESNNDSSINK